MPSFMIFFVSNTGENSLAILAFIWLLPGVSSQVYHEVTLLGERASAVGISTLE